MSTADKKAIGARLREAREAPPYWSRAEMARRLRAAADPRERDDLPHVPSLEGMIKQWEGGRYTPGRRYRPLYARVTGRTEADLFGNEGTFTPTPANEPTDQEASAPPSPLIDLLALAWAVGRLDQNVDRRTVAHLAATSAAAPALGLADPLERITGALARPTGLIRPDLVDHLEARSIGFHRLEFVLPARQIFRGLLAHLSEITTLLEVCRQDPLRKRLARTVGDTAVLGAWLAWDLGDAARAASLYRVANLAAKEADDPAISTCAIIYQSFATSAAGAHATARRSLEQARDLLPARGDQATRAWVLGRQAEETAMLGDRSARDMIQAASDLLSNAQPWSERPWTRCLESPRLSHMRLTIGTHLREEAAVYDGVGELAPLAGDPAQKKTGRILASMGLALVAIGDVREGIRFGERSVEAVRVGQATYAMDRLSELGTALQDAPVAQSLRDGIRATRLALASPRPSR
ncbi:XRE family transcriptional regulator [Actinomadura roseirufa]|uniref:XRE family transcriptional regulator n=1 Tax=Actinomadura roseirufa TaxID=2094049 RepID=UPI00104163D6|nr:XRE family transcriptional regulator [Actinomadura roseirufa]